MSNKKMNIRELITNRDKYVKHFKEQFERIAKLPYHPVAFIDKLRTVLACRQKPLTLHMFEQMAAMIYLQLVEKINKDLGFRYWYLQDIISGEIICNSFYSELCSFRNLDVSQFKTIVPEIPGTKQAVKMHVASLHDIPSTYVFTPQSYPSFPVNHHVASPVINLDMNQLHAVNHHVTMNHAGIATATFPHHPVSQRQEVAQQMPAPKIIPLEKKKSQHIVTTQPSLPNQAVIEKAAHTPATVIVENEQEEMIDSLPPIDEDFLSFTREEEETTFFKEKKVSPYVATNFFQPTTYSESDIMAFDDPNYFNSL